MQLVSKAKKIFLIFLLATTLSSFVVYCAYIVSHWFTSVDRDDIQSIEHHAFQYLSTFSAFNETKIMVLTMEKRGDYLAILCHGESDSYYLCVFKRDNFFSSRYHAIAGTSSVSGEIGDIHLGEGTDKVLVFGGADFPKEVAWYTFQNNGITYVCPINNRLVLNLFVFLDTRDIHGSPCLLNKAKEPIVAK